MPNVFETNAKISLDSKGFDEGLDKSRDKISVFADMLKANLVEKGIGLAIDGFQRLGSAVISTVQQAVESYSSYEQLVGGVETLFKDSADIVKDYAMEAYKNAGIGANQYMETVTSFSASLIQSLDGDTRKAAELSNRAIIDMSDNANKMGTSMESIMNAYMGFSKQNYTMLDNLKLGYGGTKSEMERLVEEASKMEDAQRKLGVTIDENSLSFANIVNAISVVQEKMGIAGTTADEAEKTVEGSMKMFKAAWADLLTSIAGGGKGMTEAIEAFVTSAETYFHNLIPVIQEALYGIGDLVKGLAPVIIDALPEFINTVLPNLLDAAMFLVMSVVDSFPAIVEAITSVLPDIVSQLTDVISSALVMLFESGLPMLLQLAIDIVLALSQGIINNIPQLIPALVQMMQSMAEIIVMNLPTIINAALEILMALATALVENEGEILAAITTLIFGAIDTIIVHLPEFLDLGVKIVLKIVEGIFMAIPRFFEAIGKLLGIVDDTKTHVDSKTDEMMNNVDFKYNEIEQRNQGLLIGMAGTAYSFERYTGNIQDSSNQTAETFEETLRNSIMASQGFEKVAGKTNEWAKTAEVKVYDSFGNVVRTFNTTTMKVTQETDNMKDKTNQSFGGIESGASSMSSSVVSSANNMASGISNAASEVEAACNRMNSAMSSVGGISGGGFGGARASGGWVQAGMSYLVGEMGPEVVTPSRSGFVHSADETASMLGSGDRSIVININGDIYDDERSLTRKLQSAISSVLDREMAYA